MRAVQLYHRWPFAGLTLGGCLSLTVLFRGGWRWQGWCFFDRAGGSWVVRLGPLVFNYLPLPRRRRC